MSVLYVFYIIYYILDYYGCRHVCLLYKGLGEDKGTTETTEAATKIYGVKLL
jgi:hypothetical protein